MFLKNTVSNGDTSPSPSPSASASFHIGPLTYNYQQGQKNCNKNGNESSSGDLSSDGFYGYPTDRLKIHRFNSYASIMQETSSVESSTSSRQTSRTIHTNTRMSSIYNFIVQRKTSIYGPTDSARGRAIFLIIISLMTFCGANNDFLGKLCYQSLPGPYSGYIGLYNRYWIAWLLTFGTFVICALAIIFGWEKGQQCRKFRKQWKSMLANLSIAGSCDVWVNVGRYVGLVFLPASVVTILKNGLQLLFSALFRKILEKKTLSNSQAFGILLVVVGLLLVCVAAFLNDASTASSSYKSQFIGMTIMVTVGFFGSLRNHHEQILCRDRGYNASFVVGTRSFVSIFWTLIIAIILLCIPLLYDNKLNNYTTSIETGWTDLYSGLVYISSYPIFVISFAFFVAAIYGKNITQMKVIELSSALTRNLTMQLMPIGTWLLSLGCYYAVNEQYGEPWNNMSYIRLAGFVVVLGGSYLYMKIPKDINQNEAKGLIEDIDLYGNDIVPPYLSPFHRKKKDNKQGIELSPSITPSNDYNKNVNGLAMINMLPITN